MSTTSVTKLLPLASMSARGRYDGKHLMCNEEEPILNKIAIRRAERALGYFFISLAGIFLTVEPSSLVEQWVSGWIELTWSISMIVSGSICCTGSVTDRWIGEYTGLPLLMSVMFLYALTAVFSGWGESATLFGFGCLIAAYGWSLWGRWKDVRLVKWAAVQDSCNEE